MQKRRRNLLVVLMGALLLFLGLVFQQSLLATVVMPMATVVWLLLRIFVLSIDQVIYWGLLIFLIVGFALVRLYREAAPVEFERITNSNPTLDRVSDLWSSLQLNIYESGESDTFKRQLLAMLSSMYSSRQGAAASFEIEQALKRGQILLPAPIYAFLWPAAPVAQRRSFVAEPLGSVRRVAQAMGRTPRKWLHRLSGRERAAYYQRVDALLSFMETSLEAKHDFEPFDPSDR